MLAQLARFAVRRLRAFKPRLHRLWFDIVESFTLQAVELGKGCKFAVPVRIAGGRGTLHVGHGNSFGFQMAPRLGSGAILLQPQSADAEVVIGSGNSFSNNVAIIANRSVRLGDGCQSGELVSIYDSDFHELDPATRRRSPGESRPVVIGNNVWLGSRVLVLKGVSVGSNSVIGAGSIVVCSIPANSLAVGSPAKVVRTLAAERANDPNQNPP